MQLIGTVLMIALVMYFFPINSSLLVIVAVFLFFKFNGGGGAAIFEFFKTIKSLDTKEFFETEEPPKIKADTEPEWEDMWSKHSLTTDQTTYSDVPVNFFPNAVPPEDLAETPEGNYVNISRSQFIPHMSAVSPSTSQTQNQNQSTVNAAVNAANAF